MAARKVQVFLSEQRIGELEAILASHSRRYWRESVPGEIEKYTCIVQQRYTERLLEELTLMIAGRLVLGFGSWEFAWRTTGI